MVLPKLPKLPPLPPLPRKAKRDLLAEQDVRFKNASSELGKRLFSIIPQPIKTIASDFNRGVNKFFAPKADVVRTRDIVREIPMATKEMFLPTRTISTGQTPTEKQLYEAKTTGKERLTAPLKLGAEFGTFISDIVPGAPSEEFKRTSVGGVLARAGENVRRFSQPQTIGEAKAMRVGDIVGALPIGSIKVTRGGAAVIAELKNAKGISNVLVKEVPALKNDAKLLGQLSEALVPVTNVDDVEKVINRLNYAAQKVNKTETVVKDTKALIPGSTPTVPPEKLPPLPPLPEIPAYKGETDLSTNILEKLKGRAIVSKQFISDLTNSPELKQQEKEIVRGVLENMGINSTDRAVATDFIDAVRTKTVGGGKISPKQRIDFEIEARQLAPGWGIDPELPPSKLADAFDEYLSSKKEVIDVKDFAKKVKAELLPLRVVEPKGGVKFASQTGGGKYENITLPDELRGEVKNYKENVYESPIKTSAGQSHFPNNENYFGHTRIEDMADNKTRRVIEVQSDLYQKGNLEREVGGYSSAPRNAEVAKLQQYSNPTAHFRMVREEMKRAAQDGKTKLQFPTGETALRIEGLVDNQMWNRGSKKASMGVGIQKLEDKHLRMGEIVNDGNTDWIVSNKLGEGKFKALPKDAVVSDLKKSFPNISEKEINDFIILCL